MKNYWTDTVMVDVIDGYARYAKRWEATEVVTDVRCEGGDIVVVKRPLAPGESLKAITDVYCVEK